MDIFSFLILLGGLVLVFLLAWTPSFAVWTPRFKRVDGLWNSVWTKAGSEHIWTFDVEEMSIFSPKCESLFKGVFTYRYYTKNHEISYQFLPFTENWYKARELFNKLS